jgi:hypothetical protein
LKTRRIVALLTLLSSSRSSRSRNSNSSIIVTIATITLLTISLQIDPVLAKTMDSWYDLEKKKNWEITGPFEFGIKIPSNWAWEKVYYEPENRINWHQSNAFSLYPNTLENQTAVYAMIGSDKFFTMNNAALNTYVNYKKQTPDWLFLGTENRDTNMIKLLSESDITISDQSGKKLEYQTVLDYKVAMYLTMFNGKPYAAFYQAKAPLYDEYITEFETILESITWIDDEEDEEL